MVILSRKHVKLLFSSGIRSFAFCFSVKRTVFCFIYLILCSRDQSFGLTW